MPKTNTDEFWCEYLPSAAVPPGKRHMVSMSADVHARLSQHADRLHITNPQMVATLLNLADSIENGELEL